MNPADTPPSEPSAERLPLEPSASAEPLRGAVPTPPRTPTWVWGAVALTALSVASLALVWTTQQRVRVLEQELVRRQQSSQDQSTEARLLARQAHDAAAEVAAKLALLDARVAESALQRSQVEELISSLSRSRDENVLADVEAALRVAQQQAAITGSAEPLMAALRQSEERLARYNQPRLERVRRAVARDLDRVRTVALVDLPSLSIRLDEATRLVDELPLLSSLARPPVAAVDAPARNGTGTAAPRPDVAASQAAPRGPAGAAPAPAADAALVWPEWLSLGWRKVLSQGWDEMRSLVRVTRIDHPEAMLMAPEQGYFLRENLKLRLLNARLALLTRQFDQAQGDLVQAQQMLDRYFERGSRRVTVVSELLRQVTQQSRQVSLPRPDDTLAALAAAAAGR